MFKKMRERFLSPLKSQLQKNEKQIGRLEQKESAQHEKTRQQIKDRLTAMALQIDEVRDEMQQGFSRRSQTHIVEAGSGSSSGVSAAIMQQMEARLEELSFKSNQVHLQQQWQNDALRLVAQATSQLLKPLPPMENPPLVSVIMATWNRLSELTRAIQSVRDQSYTNWECVIVDDGSDDGSQGWLEELVANDPRFRCIRQDRQGAAAARNRGLEDAQGEIVAYLDSDNEYLPHYLSQMVQVYAADPEVKCAYAALWRMGAALGGESGPEFLCRPLVHSHLLKGNYVDLNVFTHRKGLWKELGGFDEKLRRLQDWDLVLRYTEKVKCSEVPVLGTKYYTSSHSRITDTESLGYAAYQIRRKWQRKGDSTDRPRARVLYALWHYPQLSESYVRHELLGALDAGFEVEVWSEEGVAAPFPADVPVHRGELKDAIAAFNPDVIHVHWLNTARSYMPTLSESGVPVTVRGHGFEVSVDVTSDLVAQPAVKVIYLLPHQIRSLRVVDPKVKPLQVGIHHRWHHPERNKDRKLVVRVGAGLPSKDYPVFLETAKLCPEHEFVLIACHSLHRESYVDEILKINAEMGSPVKVLIDLQHEETAEWLGKAGLYLHTAHLSGERATPLGMPVSIIEAMASGCVPVLRQNAVFVENYGVEGPLYYHNARSAAHLIRKTLKWNEAQWQARVNRCLDRVYPELLSSDANTPLFEDWRRLALV